MNIKMTNLSGMTERRQIFNEVSNSVTLVHEAARGKDFCLLNIGHIDRDKDDTVEEYDCALAKMGFMKFDDLSEIMGKELANEIKDIIKEKYE